MIGLSLAPLPGHSLAGWIREQLAILTGWLDANPDRWPPWRTACALRAIHAGDEHWRQRAAEVRK